MASANIVAAIYRELETAPRKHRLELLQALRVHDPEGARIATEILVRLDRYLPDWQNKGSEDGAAVLGVVQRMPKQQTRTQGVGRAVR
jgi:hypothetical protein